MSSFEPANDLLDELIYLRKEAGFKPERVANAGLVRGQLGGRDEPFDNLRSRLVSAIGTLDEEARELLLVAYALHPRAEGMMTLRERRAISAERIGRGSETVATREEAAIQELRARLVTGWYPQSPLPRRIPELHNGLVVESMKFGISVENRCWAGSLEEWQFTAAFDGVTYLTVSATYPGTAVVDSDEYVVRTERIGDSYSHQFHRAQPFRRGGSYRLRFAIRPDEEFTTSDCLVLSSRAFHERTLRAQTAVQFIGEQPQAVWSFSGLTYPEQPGRPTRKDLLNCDAHGQVAAHWDDLHGGLFSGIAWQWRASGG